MSNNFDAFTNFLKNVPPTRAILTEEGLAEVAAVMRRELASFFSSAPQSVPSELPQTPPIMPLSAPLPNEAWISEVRQTFQTHGAAIDVLLQESITMRNLVNMLKFAVLAQAQPGPQTDQIVSYFEQMIRYTEESTDVLKVLHSLAKTVNAVMREHEE